MSNLLPEKTLQGIRREYRERFILSGSSLAIGAAVFTALSLSPTFSVLFISRPATQAQANQLQQSKMDSADITRAQTLLAQLAPVSTASSSVTNAIAAALTQRPAGVHIDDIVYNTGAAGSPATIALGGATDSRTGINKYRGNLQTVHSFTSVKLPVDDLVGAQGGRFTITLSGNF
jgi:hypothetical protein